ncbi:MAG: hypothetical protein ACTSYI_14415 [Promethearchaeota archaeon]
MISVPAMPIGPPVWVLALIIFAVISFVIVLVIVIVLKSKSRKSNLKKLEEYVFD